MRATYAPAHRVSSAQRPVAGDVLRSAVRAPCPGGRASCFTWVGGAEWWKMRQKPCARSDHDQWPAPGQAASSKDRSDDTPGYWVSKRCRVPPDLRSTFRWNPPVAMGRQAEKGIFHPEVDGRILLSTRRANIYSPACRTFRTPGPLIASPPDRCTWFVTLPPHSRTMWN